ncbi:DUF4238 domain-containing protein [Mesorhizobium sp. M0050]|uniref:DUF4238 domain-containing protein n=1 Tax=Mesorhizobium sp. M0050 TaxID=2956861 RepID=UPI00333B89ED
MDHHYIPQFYLRPWLGADHKLQEFRRGYGGWIQSGRYGTKVTGFEKNLYRVPGVTAATQHNVERIFMGMVDTRAADVRDMLLQGSVPNQPHLRHSWARFICSLLLRHPDSIHTFKERYRRDFNASNPRLQARYEEIRRKDFPTPWKSSSRSGTRRCLKGRQSSPQPK